MEKENTIIFLKQLIKDIEDDKLNDKKINSINAFKNIFENNHLTKIELTTDDMKDYFRFLIVGCYIYKLINVLQP